MTFGISLDTETGLIQGGCLAPPLACTTLFDGESTAIYHWQDPEGEQVVEGLLGGSEQLFFANASFDLAVFGSQWPTMMPLIFEALSTNRIHDVLLRQKLMDIGDGCYRLKKEEDGDDGQEIWRSIRYGLTDLHERYYKKKMEKDEWRLKYGQLRKRPLEEWPEGAIKYAVYDAEVTWKVFHTQLEQKMERAPVQVYLANEFEQVRASMALHLISCWGMRTDPVWVQKMCADIQLEQINRRKKLKELGLVKEHDDSRTKAAAVKRMRDIMGDKCELTDKGLELYRDWWGQMQRVKAFDDPEKAVRLKLSEKRRLFDQGYVKLSGEACLRSGDEVLQAYAAYGQFQTLYTKILKLKTQGLPVQTSFEVILETGRTSSFANKLIPNSIAMQNLPRKEGMRECFVPRPGCVFVAVDYAMAELVSLAQVCYSRFGYSKLREALNDGKDPHVLLGAKILNLDYEEAMARYLDGDPALKDARQKAKPVSFGFPGGLGIEKFIEYARVTYNATFTEETAQEYKNTWIELYPEMRDYFRWISDLVDIGGGFTDIKQLFSGRVRGHVPYTVACNTFFQGLTADGAKAALFESARRCYTPVYIDENYNAFPLARGEKAPSWTRLSYMYGSRIVNFVHDEEVGETKEANGHHFACELSHVMRSKYQPYTPNVIIRTEEVMMRRWRKGAKPVTHNGKSIHEGGILVPFEDRDLYKQKKAA